MNFLKRKILFFCRFGLVICFCLANGYVCAEPTIENLPTTTSQNLSFYFQDIEIKTLLQLIAKSSGLNFIISDKVKGNTTLNLKNVTWKQALDIIMQAHGLASRRTGNVLYISTIEDISTNEAKQLQATQQILDLAPLSSSIIHLKYSNATDVANLLKGAQGTLLTPRGQVSVDSRTNSVIIRDVKTNIEIVSKQIFQLDIPARQVLIEAKIVKVDADYEKQLGARFGITHKSFITGQFIGANSLRQGNAPADITNAAGTIDPTQRLNFNNPATTLISGQTPGAIGIALARVGGSFLDLELSALEGESHAQVISTPRVITSNQQKALIQTGQEIPYQEASSSGATTVTFKKAVLSLEITPQITPNNKIILTLKATQDSVGRPVQTNSGPGGINTFIPSINTQEVQSNILLNNNETVILGGIYQKTDNHSMQRIPFFGSIPIIGAFFRHKGSYVQNQELLIFITPKIINPLSSAEGYKGEE